MMRALILGGSGLVGSYLLRRAPAEVQAVGTWYTRNVVEREPAYRLDLSDYDQVMSVFAVFKPDVVIHCAGMNDVDACETETLPARRINVDALGQLCEICHRRKTRLVYISTNAVFDGENPPYREDSERNPVNMYGVLKKGAEDLVLEPAFEIPRATVIRTMLVYGYPLDGGRGNWFTRVLFAALEEEPLSIVNDTMTQPTYAGALADTIWGLVLREFEGIWHVAGADQLSLHHFANRIADVFGLREIVQHTPVASDFFPTIARRPKDTTFDMTKLMAVGFRPVGLQEGLEELYHELQTLRSDIRQKLYTRLLPV